MITNDATLHPKDPRDPRDPRDARGASSRTAGKLHRIPQFGLRGCDALREGGVRRAARGIYAVVVVVVGCRVQERDLQGVAVCGRGRHHGKNRLRWLGHTMGSMGSVGSKRGKVPLEDPLDPLRVG